MKYVQIAILASLFGFAAGAAFAQPGVGQGPGPGPMGAGPAASAPRMGMGPGSGRGVARWGADFTPGWALMNPQERKIHQDRMRSLTSYDECKAYVEQHHEQMMARAKERGGNAVAQPRRDACVGLKR